mgnify:FL=1
MQALVDGKRRPPPSSGGPTPIPMRDLESPSLDDAAADGKPTSGTASEGAFVRGFKAKRELWLEITYRALLLFAISYIVRKIYSVVTDETLMSYDAADSDSAKLFRQKERGSMTSLIGMLVLGVFNMRLDANGDINGRTSAMTMSTILGNVTGYVLDSAIASDIGLRQRELAPTTGPNMELNHMLRYGFASIMTRNFARYFLTLQFDMYISALMIEGLKKATKFAKNLVGSPIYLALEKEKLPSK